MRQMVQIALTRSDDERRQYLQQFHAGHHDRDPGPLDGFMRWAYSDPRLEDIPLLLAELERTDTDYEGALDHEADVLVRERAHGKTPAQRVADYLSLLGMENSERVRMAVVSPSLYEPFGLAALQPLESDCREVRLFARAAAACQRSPGA